MIEVRKTAALIVASGRGRRAGEHEDGPKQFRRIGGRPVLEWTLRAFLGHRAIDIVALVVNPLDRDRVEHLLTGLDDRERIVLVDGGETRQGSVRKGLEALAAAEPAVVLIHDGVRPFASDDLISRVADVLTAEDGALPVVPVADTLKRGRGGLVGETVDRSNLFGAQTPQGFPYTPIRNAHRRAFDASMAEFTDDAAIAEWAGLPVYLVEGDPDNVKLTSARDIALADQRLKRGSAMIDVRTGNGYDVHRLVEGDHVTLCGVRIPHTLTLSGHSDADVGFHALTDALLATCGQGDIGDHFPPSDPRWRGAPSRIFLAHARDLVRTCGGRIMNADVSLICEAPKIAPHRQDMCRAIAECLELSIERVSVKATTNETIGFVGRQEGIAAIATASVSFGETL